MAIEHPSGEYKGYCVVLGDGGVEYGLALYNGNEGLLHYLALMSSDDYDDTLEVLDTMNALSAQFADRELLTSYDRGIIRDLGLRYRGRGSWPIFRSMKPGYVPWRLDADEAEFLTLALRAMLEVAARVESGELSLYNEDDPDRILTRVLREDEWLDCWEVLAPTLVLAPDYPDTERLQRLAESKPRADNSLDFGIFYLYAPIRTERGRGQRPHFPVVAAIGDPVSGMVFPNNLWGANPTPADRQESLVKLLESLPFLPAQIVVERPLVAQLVESVTAPLGIQLLLGETPAIWSYQDDMMEFLDR